MRGAVSALKLLFFAVLLFAVADAEAQKMAVLPPVEIITTKQLKELIRFDSGYVVLVNAWATWCKPCVEELPRIAQLSREYAEKPVRIILVSVDDEELVSTSVKKTLVNAGIVLQTYLIAGGGDEYFINTLSPKWSGAIPSSFVFDRKGTLSEMLTGKQSYKQFESSIEKALRLR